MREVYLERKNFKLASVFIMEEEIPEENGGVSVRFGRGGVGGGAGNIVNENPKISQLFFHKRKQQKKV